MAAAKPTSLKDAMGREEAADREVDPSRRRPAPEAQAPASRANYPPARPESAFGASSGPERQRYGESGGSSPAGLGAQVGAQEGAAARTNDWTPSPSRSGYAAAPVATAGTTPGTESPGIVAEVLDLLDSCFDYFAAKFRLERYRIEKQTRRLVLRAAIVLGSAVVLLVGLIFLSVGVADLIGNSLGSLSSGRMIVGGAYVLGGIIALIAATRKGSKPSPEKTPGRR